MIFIIALILGSIYYLWDVHRAVQRDLRAEEDMRVAQVILPLARLMNKLSPEDADVMYQEFDCLDDVDPDYFIMCVRKYAWRNGIRVSQKETELCYSLIRGIPLTEEQCELFEGIRDLIGQLELNTEGLIIKAKECDN